jgi:hypothetical protein
MGDLGSLTPIGAWRANSIANSAAKNQPLFGFELTGKCQYCPAVALGAFVPHRQLW